MHAKLVLSEAWFLGRSLVFSPKCTKITLAAGLCLDPVGELELPQTP